MVLNDLGPLLQSATSVIGGGGIATIHRSVRLALQSLT
jgi:hypothetical protein